MKQRGWNVLDEMKKKIKRRGLDTCVEEKNKKKKKEKMKGNVDENEKNNIKNKIKILIEKYCHNKF